LIVSESSTVIQFRHIRFTDTRVSPTKGKAILLLEQLYSNEYVLDVIRQQAFFLTALLPAFHSLL
jgi:hypothetical protein